MAINLMGEYKVQAEHDLVADLIEEAIEQRGATVRYIARDLINPDYLLGEASMSDFKDGYQIPMYVESVEHFNGNGDIFDMMGINKVDSAIFQVAVRKFRVEVSNRSDIVRPREGDLIYLPFSDSMWEVEKVKLDQKYYQLGKNYTYRLVCKLFTYSHENIVNPDSPLDLSTETDLDDEGLKRLLGINPDRLLDEQDVIEEAQAPSKTIPNDRDEFGF